jgi:hypothetical protein
MKSIFVALIVIPLVIFDALVIAQVVQKLSYTAEDWKDLHNPYGPDHLMMDHNAFKAGARAKALLASDSRWCSVSAGTLIPVVQQLFQKESMLSV